MKRILIVPLAIASLAGLSVGVPGLLQPFRANAHGVEMEYQATQAIQITANFDTGEPMVEAQVAVFSPENPSAPWMTGTTNEQGRFVFVPDDAVTGNWEVQVRQAGHGDIISIPVADGGVTQESSLTGGGLSMVQKAVMAGAVIWGFVGTALYFSPRKS